MTADLTQTEAEPLRDRIEGLLTRARQRTQGLTDCVTDDDLIRQHSPLMSPLVWDLAHVANQEELWLLREVAGRDPMHPEIDSLYDAFEHPRAERPTLPLMRPAEARAYAHEVRGRVLDVLERVQFRGARLLKDGFAFGMIAQHEQQHDETMLATHQLRVGAPALSAPPPDPAPADVLTLPAEVLVPGGPFTMGTSTEPWALDNERPAHVVDLAPFWIDTTPVTNAAWLEFIAAGGYDRPEYWTGAGWAHRQRAGLTAPQFWRREAGQWLRTRFGVTEPVPPAEPVVHVCWYEADAYARWAGRRLPREAEWEKAARYDPATGRSLRFPWGDGEPTPGRANLGQRHLQPARPAPTRRAPRRRRPAADRRRVGMDVQRLPALPGVHRLALPGVFRGVLRPGLQGAARLRVLRRPGGLPQHVPQLGLPDPAADLRRAADGAGRVCRGGSLMCRHLAYLGPPVTLRSLLCDPPHGLATQSWAPRRQRHGTVNVDGFGVGWYAPATRCPPYRRAGPVWADPSFADLARVTRSGAVLAAVRSATAGTEPGEAAAAPFAGGRWLFSHNGVLTGWPAAAAGLAAALPPADLIALPARS